MSQINNNFFLDDYKLFVADNFPNSSIIKEFNSPTFFETYKLIQKIIFHTDLCIDVAQTQGDQNFLKEIRNSYFELLYILPLHDDFISSSVFRGLAESVIRFIVYHEKKDTLEYSSVKGFSYTTLKEYYTDPENVNLYKIQTDIQVYFNLFKVKSQIIHDPLANIGSFFYLNNFIESNSHQYFRDLSKQLKLLWKFHRKTMGPLIGINYNQISLGNKSKIQRLFTPSEIDDIYIT